MPELQEREDVVRSIAGGSVVETRQEAGALIVVLRPQSLREVVERLRDDPRTSFNHLSYITAVDYSTQSPRFELVYELYSVGLRQRLRIKCRLDDTGDARVLPEIDSISDLYLTANWHERETYDLMGINFRGHPDLRRILLPDLWDGHPLRKEYPYDGKQVWEIGTSVAEPRGTAERSLGMPEDDEEELLEQEGAL